MYVKASRSLLRFLLVSVVCLLDPLPHAPLSPRIRLRLTDEKFSRASKRAATIMFSEHAVVERIGKNLYFSFLVFDAREKTPLNEAEARCYAVRHGASRRTGPGGP